MSVFTVGWISCIRVLGDIFDLKGFYIWHLVMTIIMCILWVVLFSLTLVAFFKGEIFYAKDEDMLKDIVTVRLEDAEKEKGGNRESADTERPGFHQV